MSKKEVDKKDKKVTDILADDFMSREELLERLETETRVFKNKLVKSAFSTIDRRDFVLEDYKVEAYEDYPLPIGQDQTISQPTTVAYMLELLDPQAGHAVLDVGSGSGYTTALLAHIVGDTGTVVGLEVRDELIDFSKKNIEKYSFENVRIEKGEGGIPEFPEAPFDRVLVSAGASEIPQAVIDQLKVGGVVVIPVVDTQGGHTLVRLKKDGDGKHEKQAYPGFAFVPFKE